MHLYSQQQGTGKPLVILHGLFGSSDNWRTIAKQLATSRQVHTVDLRNHGRSPHSDIMNYPLMADDAALLIEQSINQSCDVIGHSIGGKVAMALAEQRPDLINKLIVVDIAPKAYKDRHSDIFQALQTLDIANMTRRSEADSALSESISDKAIRQFLLMNLASLDGQLKWRVNLPVLAQQYKELRKAVCETTRCQHKTLFLCGERSDYIEQIDNELIVDRFPNAKIATIEGVGHWIHAEAPELFLQQVEAFLNHD